MKCGICFLIALFILLPVGAYGRSILSPRHSGLEAPGSPRQLDSMPGRPLTRTPQGGMGYTDAYGNTLDDQPPPEKIERKRLRPGAHAAGAKRQMPAELPDPEREPSNPLWKF